MALTFEETVKLLGSLTATVGLINIFVTVGLAFMARASARKLEEYKKESGLEAERLRSDLRAYSYRQEVQYSKLYEKRMALFGEMYALAWDVQGCLQAWMNEHRIVRTDEAEGDLQEAIRRQKARDRNEMVEALNNLIRLVNRNVLYLPEAQATRVLAIVAHMRKASFTYSQWDFMERRNNLTDEQAQKIWNAHDTAEKMVREQLDAMLAEFLKDARELLEERRTV